MKAFLTKMAAALMAYGPWGFFFLGVVDSLGVPMPMAIDLLLVTVGAVSVSNPRRAFFNALIATAGSVAGNLALFLAARGGARWLFRVAPEPAENQGFRRWFNRYGLLAVFIPAVTPTPPLPLKVFVVSAGALRTSLTKFLAVIIAARLVRYCGEVYLGLVLGKDAPGFLTRNGWTLAGCALALTFVLWLVLRAAARRQAAV